MSPVLLPMLASAALATGGFAHKLDVESRVVLDYREGHISVAPPPLVDRALNPAGMVLTLRFESPLSPLEIKTLERRGVAFVRHGGTLHSIANIYTAQVSWSALDALLADRRVVRMEAAVPLNQHPPLDVSGPEIQADETHLSLGADSAFLDGTGVVLMDLDTGVDVTHPVFFRPDGGSFDWIDVDSDGLFSPGIDAVDLDGDGAHTSAELLQLLDARVLDYDEVPWVGTQAVLDADVDWLYLDEDGDSQRGSGAGMGFTDADPAFGEPLFIVEDADGDGDLGLGERLLKLDSSKIIATLDGDDGEEHFSGDIIDTETDDNGHGTAVSGILLGEYDQYRKYRGVAPGASLILADIYGQGTSHVDAVAWGEANGADVMLHEVGGWTGRFLDGTSNTELAIEAAHAAGTPQICPAGNIGKNYKHGSVQVPASGSWEGPYYFYASDYLETYGSETWWFTVLSLDSLANLELAMRESGTSDWVYPTFPSTSQCEDNGVGVYVCGTSDASPAGTQMWSSYMTRWENSVYSTPPTGWWQFWFRNSDNQSIDLHLWVKDDITSWSGGVQFVGTPADQTYYVGDAASSATTPSVVEDCVTVAAYSTRTDAVNGDFSAGSFGLASSSGQGPRIDGASLVDIAAPGNFDVLSSASSTEEDDNNLPYGEGVFTPFGGTSAAGPHVAAAAGLLLQAHPGTSPDDITTAIRSGAGTDSETSSALPDETWGYGKLRIMDAVQAADTSPPTYDLLQSPHALLPEATEIILAPNESLGAVPQVTVTLDGNATSTLFDEDGYGLWSAWVATGTVGVQAVLEDLAGNVQ